MDDIEIETWGDRPDPLELDWHSTIPGNRSGKRGVVDVDTLLDEAHHRQYGRPWGVGRSCFDYLVEIGLLPHNRVLDAGCGAGRVGIHLIRYLDPHCYFGIDSHMRSLEAFARYEIPLHALAGKRPRLAHNATFDFSKFDATFDCALDLFVSFHLPKPAAAAFYTRMVDVLAPQGRIVTGHKPVLDSETMATLGLEVERVDVRPAFLLAESKRGKAKEDTYYVLRRRAPLV